MSAKYARALSLATLLLVGANTAYAQRAYVAASGGVSLWNVDCAGTTSCEDSGTSFRVAGGYNFVDIAGRVQVGVEAFYMNLGKTTGAVAVGGGRVNATIEGSGYGLALATSGRFVSGSRFGYHARIGVANVESELSGTALGRSIAGSKQSVRGVVGLGANFFVTPNFSLRAEVDITSVKWPDNQTSGVISVLGGVALHF